VNSIINVEDDGEEEEEEKNITIFDRKMASEDIPAALTIIYSYLVNGNIAKSHAFSPKSDYINGLI
jgi:hypothetical protein